MAKRFTATDKWQDEWFSDLEQDMKLVWLYLLDSCDHAGIWKRNIKLLQYHTGTVKKQLEIETTLGNRICPFDNDKWFIPKFLKFQYSNGLNSDMPAIKSVRETLEKYNLLLTVKEQLGNSYLTVKDKDKDKDKDMDKDKDKDKRKRERKAKTGKPTENSRKTLEGKKPPSDITIFLNYTKETFLSIKGEKLHIDWGKDSAIVKSLLGTYDLLKLKSLWDRFLFSKDKFILDSGFSIGVFKSQVNKLTTARTTTHRPPQFEEL